METGVNSTEIYDLKKYLTGICRDIGSVDMANVLFYVRLLPLEKIKMTEQEVLDHLFLPQSMTHITSSRPLSLQETRSKKENLSLIEQLWRSPVGFMLPVRTKKGVRFMTQMSFSPKVFDLYTDLYAPAPLVEKSPTILKKMVE